MRFAAAVAGLMASLAIGASARADGAAAASALEGTRWKLVAVGEAAAVGEAYLELQAEGKRLAGSGGCNRLLGGYELQADALHFGRVAATRMACAEPLMKQEAALEAALEATTGYRIEGRTLELRDGERVLARFEAGP